MQAPEVASHVLYGVVEPDADGDQVREVQLQGTMHFAAAEVALRELERVPDVVGRAHAREVDHDRLGAARD